MLKNYYISMELSGKPPIGNVKTRSNKKKSIFDEKLAQVTERRKANQLKIGESA